MKAAIIQSNFFPWKGYFDIIHDADIFVFLEDVQYTKNDWRNRNKIKTPFGAKWITVPIKGGINQKIFEVQISNSTNWIEKQKRQIDAAYSRAQFYDCFKEEITNIYLKKFDLLSELNIYAIKKISKLLDIDTKFLNSTDIKINGIKTEKIIHICQEVGATSYISGPAAKAYINENDFINAGITLKYKDYNSYPEYPQLWGKFDHNVSIIDLLFNCGENTSNYIWGWRNGK